MPFERAIIGAPASAGAASAASEKHARVPNRDASKLAKYGRRGRLLPGAALQPPAAWMTVLGGALSLDGEGQGSPGGELPVDLGGRLSPAHRPPHPLELAAELELVSGLDHPLEPNAVDPGEERQLAAVLVLREHGHGTGLRHRLHDQDTRHDRTPGKVAGQVPLVWADALPRHHALPRSEVDNFIEKQEWIAMRQDRLDLAAG